MPHACKTVYRYCYRVFNGTEDKRLMEDHKQEVDTLQRKVSELQAEYKLELRKAKDLREAHWLIIDRLIKK